MQLDHSTAPSAVVLPDAGVLQNEVCQPQEEWNVAASFADEEPDSCISALEFRRAVSSAGSVYCEQIRALRIPPDFPGFAVDRKVSYLADCLQTMGEACRDEFLRLHHRADEQDRSIPEFSTCLQNGDSAMFAENDDLQRLNALEDGVNDELSKLSSKLQTSEQAALQLQQQVDHCNARQVTLEATVGDLTGRLSSLESRFAEFSAEVSSNFTEAFARIDTFQTNCLGRSEAAHAKLVLIRTALSQVEETVRQHAVVFNEVHGGGLLRAHGALAAEVADLRQLVCSLQVATQTLPVAAASRGQRSDRAAPYPLPTLPTRTCERTAIHTPVC